MPDYKDSHSISYQILLWTLLGYVLMYSRLSLFFLFVLLFVFFVCGDYDATQDRFSYTDFLTQISLHSGNVFSVMLSL
jgi:hypothetical protein